MASEPPPGILGGIGAVINSGRAIGIAEMQILDDLLVTAAALACHLGIPSEEVASRLAVHVARIAAILRERAREAGEAVRDDN